MLCYVADIEAWSKQEVITKRSVQLMNVEKMAVADGSAVVASDSLLRRPQEPHGPVGAH